jgi:hypothetical protein
MAAFLPAIGGEASVRILPPVPFVSSEVETHRRCATRLDFVRHERMFQEWTVG